MSKDRVLPNFLGIGASRSGTSWIYEILKSHPEIYMSEPKELNFFTLNYDKGIEWYSKFFKNGKNRKIIGEYTPRYFYDITTPKKIKKELGPNTKFIIVLRNPIERSYSSFKKYQKDNSTNITFEEFLRIIPSAKKNSFYAKHLENWLKYFNIENFLILIYEEIEVNPKIITEEVSKFLEIEEEFNFNLLNKKINSSNKPKPYFLYKIGLSIRNKLGRNFPKISYLIESIGKKILYVPKNKNLKKQDIKKYQNIYSKDIKKLEKILNRKIYCWR